MNETYITSFPTRGVSNNRVATLGESLVKALEPLAGLPLPIATDLLEEIRSLLRDLNAALLRERASEITGEKLTKDEQRDQITLGFIGQVESSSRHFDPDKAAAAQLLQGIIERREPRFYARGYDDNTHQLKLLFSDLASPEAVQALATLGLTPWVDQLQKENQAFEALVEEERNITAGDETPLLSPVKNLLAKRFRLLLEIGEFYAERGDESVRAAMNLANTHITEMKSTLRVKAKEETAPVEEKK